MSEDLVPYGTDGFKESALKRSICCYGDIVVTGETGTTYLLEATSVNEVLREFLLMIFTRVPIHESSMIGFVRT